jgi:hypothetical protein
MPKENNTKQLPAINESFEAQPPALFALTFEHTTQIVELTLRILFTKQIENCLASSNLDDMKVIERKLKNLIEFYTTKLTFFKQKIKQEAHLSSEETTTPVLLIKSHQNDKIKLIIKLLIYYRNLVNEVY